MKIFNLIRLVLLILVIASAGCLRRAPATQIANKPEPTLLLPETSTPSIQGAVAPKSDLAMAEIRPMRYSLDIKGAEWVLEAAQEGLSLRVAGIYAINQKVAFMFGSFTSKNGDDVRSVLFRTENGGQNWVEVMQPFTFSEVSHVLFVQNGLGWASIALNAEGLAGTNYWHTSDYGKTWEELPNTATGMGEDVLGIRFFDPLHGQRKLFDLTGNPNTDGLVIETTDDGGHTWDESLRVHTPGIMDPAQIIASYAEADGGRYGSHWGSCKWTLASGCEAFGEDGSALNIQTDKNNKYYIFHIQSLDAVESTDYRVPIDFIYQDGNLVAS